MDGKLDVYAKMETPVIPAYIINLLEELDVSGKKMSWNFQDCESSISLTPTWTNFANGSTCTSTPVCNGNSTIDKSTTSMTKTPVKTPVICKSELLKTPSKKLYTEVSSENKIKKSPSRIKRDRKRLKEFRKQKQNKLVSKEKPTIDATLAGEYDGFKTVFLGQCNVCTNHMLPEITLPVENDTTTMELKEWIVGHLQCTIEPAKEKYVVPECISLYQVVGSERRYINKRSEDMQIVHIYDDDEFVINEEFCNCQLVFNVHLDIPPEYYLYSDYQESDPDVLD